jgi:hypothetical protein
MATVIPGGVCAVKWRLATLMERLAEAIDQKVRPKAWLVIPGRYPVMAEPPLEDGGVQAAPDAVTVVML